MSQPDYEPTVNVVLYYVYFLFFLVKMVVSMFLPSFQFSIVVSSNNNGDDNEQLLTKGIAEAIRMLR